MDGINENVFEFLRNGHITTATVCQGRYINQIRESAKTHPDECKIDVENADGSIVAHFPTAWLKIRPPRKINLSEEEKEELRERLRKARESKNSKAVEELEDELGEDFEDEIIENTED